jgi:hypothetical protein
MEHVIAERLFAEPITGEMIEAMMRENRACLTSHRVRHLRSYISPDGRRTICEYEAPDAEAVRALSERLGVPYERVWTATILETGSRE